MIRVSIFREGDGKISEVAVSGHSGLADRGEDIVCAGVSSLVQSAYLGLVKHLHREVAFQQASGDFQMVLAGQPDDLTDAILETMLLGLKEIASISPKGVRITETRR
jgi:hypothetical protein